MAKINQLTKRAVDTLGAGFHSDGGNLYLRVKDGGARSWVFRYKVAGKVAELGLGPTHTRGLAEARTIAEAMRNALKNGNDPASVLAAKRDPNAMTFRKYAEQLIAEKQAHFKSGKHGKQWPATLEAYAYPVIGDKRPADVTLTDIETILRPIWKTKTETANRVRGRIENVLDYAFVAEGIDRRNPAVFKGNLEHRGFAPASKLKNVEHHPAAPYADVPAIMAEARTKDSMSALLLRFTILTWKRSTEVRDATWQEIDMDNKLWTIPARRMKAKMLHRCPLCSEAVEILKIMRARYPDSDRVFPGDRGGRMSDVAVNKALHSLPTVKRLDALATAKLRLEAVSAEDREATAHGATVHGFRSSAESWGAAETKFESQVLEFQLAHADENKVRKAYQRDDLLEKRRKLVDAWGTYCRSTVRLASSL